MFKIINFNFNNFFIFFWKLKILKKKSKKFVFSIFCFLSGSFITNKRRLVVLKKKQFFFRKKLKKKSTFYFFKKHKLRLGSFFLKSKKSASIIISRFRKSSKFKYINKTKIRNYKYHWDIISLKMRSAVNVLFNPKQINSKNFFKKTKNQINFINKQFDKIGFFLFFFKLIKNKKQFVTYKSVTRFVLLNNTPVTYFSQYINKGSIISFIYNRRLLFFWIKYWLKTQRRFLKKKQKFRWIHKNKISIRDLVSFYFYRTFEFSFINGSFFKIKNNTYLCFNYFLLNYIRFFNWRTYGWLVKKRYNYSMY